MTFQYPQALLLALPLAFALWRWGRRHGPAMWLRALMLFTLTLAFAEPALVLHRGGSDVVIVADRSRSMPARSESAIEELAKLVAAERKNADCLGVISFGREVRVDLPLTAEGAFGGFQSTIDGEASSLASALDRALEMIPEGRAGRIVVISDGRATGADARAAARRLAARSIPIDYRWLGREDAGLDVAVSALDVPASVAEREPFQLTATLHASAATTVTLQLSRDGRPLVKAARQLHTGDNVVTLRDLVEQAGFASYELQILAEGDAVPQNDVGRAVTRVEGPPKIAVFTDKPEGALVRTLAQAKVDLVVKKPGPVDMASLENVGAVVLEDVEASRLTENGLAVLAQYVKEAGGGLVMTGGKNAFGEGGYRKSPIEDVLPVSLELRQEQRKAALAMSIVLDSSGSMGVAVPDGRTKMQLAAEGVVAALQLLNPKDDASVFLVDTTPHEIFDMRPVASGLPLDKVARAFTGGGGIYIGVGLATAKREIDKSSKPTRHVLLFADASDSEEPADYEHTIAKLVADGVTVSVIGMGKRTDSDADLLVDVARLGGGRIYFAEDVLSLPRIFSQETIAVARSSFVDVAVPLALGPDLSLLGALSAAGLPRIGGYNLTYLKAQASLGLRSDDDNRAPVVAFWQRGAGRVVTITAEVDGQHTGDLANWSERRALLENAVRWTMPTEPGVVDAAARARLVGDDLHVTLDFDPKTPPLGNATLVVLAGDGRAEPALVPMSWEDYDRVGAHFKVHGSGVFHPVVRVGARTFRAPAVTLAYAPEFEPGSARGGKELLAALAKASHGKERLTMAGVFAGTTASASREPFAPWLVALAVVMLLCEVSVRRFWPERRRTGRKKVAPPAPSALARTTTAAGRTDPVVQATHSVRADAPAHPSPAPGQPTVGNVESAIERALHRTRKRTER